ncbi:MAG: hypothetical protein JWP89_5977 [Schlesneria sp.]|nr:hypothetical protein [Schlesneria sp.]
MPTARGANVLVVLGIALAAVSFVIGRPLPEPDESRPQAEKMKYLERVASMRFRRGMSRASVVACLKPYKLHEVSFGDEGVRMTCFYGKRSLLEPVIFVEFQRDGNQIFRVTGWHIEK